VLTEGLSAAGVPVFVADIKGDLSGLAVPGASSEKLLARTASLGQEWVATASPVEFLSLGGLGERVAGAHDRSPDFGPLLLAKVLGLNATQESSLGLIMHWADTQGLALLDLKDLQATIAYLVSDEGKPLLKGIGGLSAATAGVILREIVSLAGPGCRRVLRGAGVRRLRAAADHAGRRGVGQAPGAAGGAGPAGPVLDVPHVAAGRAVPGAARRWETPTSRGSCSSSTRRTCCSRARRATSSRR
jgi:DNA helicase HerA-like ATPase